MTARLVCLCALLGLFFTLLPHPVMARDSAEELCHRYCSAEYDKLATAKDKLAALARRMEKQKMRLAHAEPEAVRGLQSALRRMEEEKADLESDIAQAQKAYDACMRKCLKDPKIQEKIPDSVLGDLSTPEQRRKWKDEEREKIRKTGRAMCPACEEKQAAYDKALERADRADDAVREHGKRQRKLDEERSALDNEARKHREELETHRRRAASAEARQKIPPLMGRNDHEEAKEEQERSTKRMNEEKKELDDLGRKQEKLDKKSDKLDREKDRLETEQFRAVRKLKEAEADMKDCNDKCPVDSGKKSFLKSVIPGFSFGISGGGGHHRREPERYEGGELERR